MKIKDKILFIILAIIMVGTVGLYISAYCVKHREPLKKDLFSTVKEENIPRVKVKNRNLDTAKKCSNYNIDQAIRKRLGIEPKLVKDMLSFIQSCIARDDAKALAKIILYPIIVSIDNKDLILESPEQFVSVYHKIINDKVRKSALLQKYETLFIHSRGIGIGDGSKIWLVGTGISSIGTFAEGGPLTYYDSKGRKIINARCNKETVLKFIELLKKSGEDVCYREEGHNFVIWEDAGFYGGGSSDYWLLEADINNDGEKEYIVTYMGGSLGCTGIAKVYALENSKLKSLKFDEIYFSNFGHNIVKSHMYIGKPFLIEKKGKVYMSFDRQPCYIYLWEGDKISFVETIPWSAK